MKMWRWERQFSNPDSGRGKGWRGGGGVAYHCTSLTPVIQMFPTAAHQIFLNVPFVLRKFPTIGEKDRNYNEVLSKNNEQLSHVICCSQRLYEDIQRSLFIFLHYFMLVRLFFLDCVDLETLHRRS